MENPAVISGLVALNFVRSLLVCNMAALLVGFHQLCVKSMIFLFTQINLVSQADSPGRPLQQGEVAVSTPRKCCTSCQRHLDSPAGRLRDENFPTEARREAPSAAEIELIMERLGVKFEKEDETQRCRDCLLVEAAEGVLEGKEASVEEMAEAFAVFDNDGDGYVGPEDLQDVMRRLGMEEGAELEDCRKMIGAYDGDGDGRIDVADFRRLLESAA